MVDVFEDGYEVAVGLAENVESYGEEEDVNGCPDDGMQDIRGGHDAWYLVLRSGSVM